ncbi:hypothetical protein [Algibacillus agarilyticus]|uniref:hypothetical protein n=1 Tax=Algibacillus agarilyticus TaxID=2234133 RepID=UPI0013005B7E|nr:hypothetical protein [Algibacillus agarilyticus]
MSNQESLYANYSEICQPEIKEFHESLKPGFTYIINKTAFLEMMNMVKVRKAMLDEGSTNAIKVLDELIIEQIKFVVEFPLIRMWKGDYRKLIEHFRSHPLTTNLDDNKHITQKLEEMLISTDT